MGAMQINKSGMTARDGLSGAVDGPNTVGVRIIVCGLGHWRSLNTEQALDLRQRGQSTLLRPSLDLFYGQLQQDGEVLVAANTEPVAQRALTEANVALHLYAQLRAYLTLGFGRIWPEDVRAELVTGDASRHFNCDATFCWDATAVVPAGYRRRLDAEELSKSLLATCRLNCSIEG